MSQTIAIASDHAGFALKQTLVGFLSERGYTLHDLGAASDASVDYPDFGYAIANHLGSDNCQTGIAICGSGIGISIAANRHAQARAALCHDGLSAELARRHNDANILCLGARLIGEETAKDCAIKFLTTEFEGGRHTRRVNKLSNPNS